LGGEAELASVVVQKWMWLEHYSTVGEAALLAPSKQRKLRSGVSKRQAASLSYFDLSLRNLLHSLT
jgi:hypothetical protein